MLECWFIILAVILLYFALSCLVIFYLVVCLALNNFLFSHSKQKHINDKKCMAAQLLSIATVLTDHRDFAGQANPTDLLQIFFSCYMYLFCCFC